MEVESLSKIWENRILRVMNRQQAAPQRCNPGRHNPWIRLQVSQLISKTIRFPRFKLGHISYFLAFIKFRNVAGNEPRHRLPHAVVHSLGPNAYSIEHGRAIEQGIQLSSQQLQVSHFILSN